MKRRAAPMRPLATGLALAVCAFGTQAHAQQPQPSPPPEQPAQAPQQPAPPPQVALAAPTVWTTFDTYAPHATVAAIACGLGANAYVEGRLRMLSLQALEDGKPLCTAPDAPGAIHGRLKMTTSLKPTEVIVELDVPPDARPGAINDLRGVVVHMAADLGRRANATVAPTETAPPPPLVQAPPPAAPPMHEVKVTNTPLIGAGVGLLAGGYFLTALVGLAIVSASGDPGTDRFWPFVPFVGAVAFSSSYKEAPNCGCEAGRTFAIFGSVIIEALQVTGVVLTIVGAAVPRTKLVPDTVSLRLGVTGAVLEGRF